MKHASKNARTKPKWRAPGGDILKINTDGSFDPRSRIGGWGFVVRDSEGEVMGAGAGKLNHVSDAFQAEAEAEACSHALQVAQNWGMSRIQSETDSQLLVQEKTTLMILALMEF